MRLYIIIFDPFNTVSVDFIVPGPLCNAAGIADVNVDPPVIRSSVVIVKKYPETLVVWSVDLQPQ
ncbi:hypothetical protein [Methanolacinia petrolearia]|uniref:hypothetical protein n=1 Tax=Methanolacinia petrolearia TaxID=54120 RepID=UPI003BAC74C6